MRGDALASLVYVNNWHQILAEQSYFDDVRAPVAAAAPVVAGRRGAVLPAVAARARVLHVAARAARGTALLTLAGWRSSRRSPWASCSTPARPLARLLRHRHPRDGAADRRAARVRVAARRGCARRPAPAPRSCSTAARSPGSCSSSRAILSWQDYDAWVYRGGLTIVVIAGARDDRGGRPSRLPRPAIVPRRRPAALDRPAQLRDLPVALAGDGAHPPGRRPATGPVAAVPFQIGAHRGDRRRLVPLGRAADPARAREGGRRPDAPPRRRLAAIASATLLAIVGRSPDLGLASPRIPRADRRCRRSADALGAAATRHAARAGAAAEADRRRSPAAARGRCVGDARRADRSSPATRPSTPPSAARRRTSSARLEAYKAAGELPEPRDRADRRERPGARRGHPRAARGAARRAPRGLIVNVRTCRALERRGQPDPRGDGRRTGRRRGSPTGTT